MRRQVFNILHRIFRPADWVTVKLITVRFVWPSINRNVTLSHFPCKQTKIHQHTASPGGPFAISDVRTSHIRIDVSLASSHNITVSKFGVSATGATDRGFKFNTVLFRHFNSLLGTNRIQTTAYHPQGNGLLSILSTLQANLRCTAANLLFGTPLKRPDELVPPSNTPTSFDPSAYVCRLRGAMHKMHEEKPWTSPTNSFIPFYLNTRECVLVGHG
ncbi:unnamed protein product, partial [Dibothriocephalus latus]